MLNDTSKNLMLTEWKGAALYVGLLNDSDVEISGGSPAYARKAVTWGTAASGAISASNVPIVFDVPAGAVVSKIAYYSAVTGGTQYGIYDTVNETYGGQGTYSVTSLSVNLNK